ncbi:hypothetical protein LY76DRAFT_591447 [Colletotrichum caudatum]|nr:hypothetical protein LY76DRAFT_591447 [Colletotrichum caudatum]
MDTYPLGPWAAPWLAYLLVGLGALRINFARPPQGRADEREREKGGEREGKRESGLALCALFPFLLLFLRRLL